MSHHSLTIAVAWSKAHRNIWALYTNSVCPSYAIFVTALVSSIDDDDRAHVDKSVPLPGETASVSR